LLRFVRVEQLLHIIASSPAATLAFASGRNFGAGVDLFAVCQRRIATAEATFRMPGLKFGLVLGTRRFASLVGREAARSILETARQFSADEAKALGFLSAIAPVDEWPRMIEDTVRCATTLPDGSRISLYSAICDEQPDTDLATLVRSAAVPGLKARLQSYIEAERSAKK
jgi:enoyl-CoA hydratase/carnithine racemase